MENLVEWKNVIGAVLYSVIGVGIFGLCYGLLEFFTPKVNLWNEMTDKQNVALAVFLGAVMLGIAIIIGAAVHG
jgi:putative membrane protein